MILLLIFGIKRNNCALLSNVITTKGTVTKRIIGGKLKREGNWFMERKPSPFSCLNHPLNVISRE